MRRVRGVDCFAGGCGSVVAAMFARRRHYCRATLVCHVITHQKSFDVCSARCVGVRLASGDMIIGNDVASDQHCIKQRIRLCIIIHQSPEEAFTVIAVHRLQLLVSKLLDAGMAK